MNQQLSRRAALQRQQEAEARAAKTKRLTIAGLVLLGLIVAVVVGVVLVQALSKPSSSELVTPPNGTHSHGILLQGKAPSEGTPHLVIWEDYRCGGCAAAEAQFGPVIHKLVADGTITAEHRQSYFLDGQARNGQSKKAALAAAAADQVGKFAEVHTALYATRSQGQDFTDTFLRDHLPAAVGIGGDDLAAYQKALDDSTYAPFVDAAQAAFDAQGVNSTPTFFVGDTEVPLFNDQGNAWVIEPTEDALMAAIEKAAG